MPVKKITVKKDDTSIRMWTRVRVRVSFNGMHKGDEADLEWNTKLEGWIAVGLVEEVHDGAHPTGPSGAEPGDHERLSEGADGSLSTGGESSEGFGAGGYGAFA